MPEALDFPVRRNLPQPLDSRVLHGSVRIKSLGDGTSDERGTLLLKQLDQPLLLLYERIDLRFGSWDCR